MDTANTGFGRHTYTCSHVVYEKGSSLGHSALFSHTHVTGICTVRWTFILSLIVKQGGVYELMYCLGGIAAETRRRFEEAELL